MVWAIKIYLNYVNKVLTMMEILPQLIFINQHQSHLFGFESSLNNKEIFMQKM
jgi:hypothetical protein